MCARRLHRAGAFAGPRSAASATGRALSRPCRALCLGWAANGIAHSERTGKSHEIGRPPPLLLQQQVGPPGAGCREEGGYFACVLAIKYPCPTRALAGPPPAPQDVHRRAQSRPTRYLPEHLHPEYLVGCVFAAGFFGLSTVIIFWAGSHWPQGPGLAHSPIAGVLSRWRQAGTPAAKSCRRRPKNRISLKQLKQRRAAARFGAEAIVEIPSSEAPAAVPKANWYTLVISSRKAALRSRWKQPDPSRSSSAALQWEELHVCGFW